jgi:hypothetical protein
MLITHSHFCYDIKYIAKEEVTEHWSFMITVIIKYYLGDQIKMDGMGRAWGMQGGK